MRPQTAGPAAGGGLARGKLASLLTCIAERRVLGAGALWLQRILAVHLRGAALPAHITNATELVGGVRDFAFDF